MRKFRQDALRAAGYDIERYYVEGWPPVWGLALRRDNRDVAVIESHGDHTNDDSIRNKYVVRETRATLARRPRGQSADLPTPETKLGRMVSVHKTQREATLSAMQRDKRLNP